MSTAALEQAREARSDQHRTVIWRQVTEAQDTHSCHCELRPGMTWDQLLELGEGCTAGRGYICPALDTYRRLVGVPRR